MPRAKKKTTGLGQSLIRHRFNRAQGYDTTLEARQADPGYDDFAGARPPGLESVIERNDLDELMAMADLAGRDFSAERGAATVVIKNEEGGPSEREKEQQRLAEEELNRASLKIPRRPPWHADMGVDELERNERAAFLEWRRGLARLEENERLVITPFEKNLDIWRQLWRVVERSDLVVTVVDARNPLFYRCEDLEDFVREVSPHKTTMLLLNKADLLPATVRRSWARYLKTHGIAFLFWSAKRATSILEGKIAPEEMGSVSGDEEIRVWGREELLSRLEAEAEAVVSEREAAGGGESAPPKAGPGKHHKGGHAGHTKPEGDPSPEGTAHAPRVVVGFVGYPNVGKSSTINALVGEKKTGVTSTPGKTKHFQTLLLRDHPRLMLCDCPGLVFPSFSSSKAEMVAAGVLPIDRLTDNRSPVQIVAERVPRALLEGALGITLPAPAEHEAPDRAPTAAELLRSFCRSRGYVGASGLPDETKAARMLLKDYVDGKLLYCALPPGEEALDRPRGVAPVAMVRVGGGAVIGSERFDAEDEEGEESSEYETESEGEEDGPEAVGVDDKQEEVEVTPPPGEASSRGAENVTASGIARDVFSDQGLRSEAAKGGAGVASTRGGGDDFDVLSSITGATSAAGSQRHRNRANAKPDYKVKRKAARVKDRSWRAFQVDNDTDGMPIVRGMAKPVSHGAAARASVADQARKDLELLKSS